MTKQGKPIIFHNDSMTICTNVGSIFDINMDIWKVIALMLIRIFYIEGHLGGSVG